MTDNIQSATYLTHEMIITFANTNAEGNVSHHEYGRIFGEVRELFAIKIFPGFRENAGKSFLLKTRETHYKLWKDLYFGDLISVRMWVSKLDGASFCLCAEFIKVETGEVHAFGEHQIVFADTMNIPRKIPENMRGVLAAYAAKPNKT